MRARLSSELAAAGLPTGPPSTATVTPDDLSRLPLVVRRYLSFMGVEAGVVRDWSFRARFVGRFRLRPRLGWMPAEAWQYDSGLVVARVFAMRLRFAGVVPLVGTDTYLDGRGRMVGRLFDRVTVADGSGEEFDTGELTTYLNDALLLAPSMLLGLDAEWTAGDARSFDVRLSDTGRSVTGRLFVDDRGAPVDFSSTDRFIDLPGGPRRAEWRTPVDGWDAVGGRSVPTRARALWLLSEGPLPYVDGRFVPESLAWNVAPS